MKLVAVTIENFQGIVEEATITVNDFNVLIGRNDVGKSTVLKALNCFLHGTTPTSESSNVSTDSAIVSIELVFDPQNEEIVIDEAIPTSFEAEELTNADGHLCVKRVWDTSKAKINADTFIVRKGYDENDFVGLTEHQLILLCRNCNIETNKANGDNFNNVEKREKLKEFFSESAVQFSYVHEKLPTSGNSRFKNVHNALKKALPRFEFFRADTSLSETDTAIQNYFRQIASDALSEFGMSDAEDAVVQRLNSALGGITNKINDAVPQDEAVRPVTTFDWSKVVKTVFATGDDASGVALHLRGDGFRRITMMAYFEYLAEQRQQDTRKVIFGFEEPETFLHPAAQEKLFEKLAALSESGYQVLVSSHSPIIVSNTNKTDLIHVTKEDGKTQLHSNVDDILAVANDLGISMDNQFVHLFDSAKVLFLVEGIDDANAFHFIANTYKANNEITDTFEDLDIVIVPIGGCGSIKHWVALDLLTRLSKPYYILLDSDVEIEGVPSPNRETLVEYGFIEGTNFSVTRKRMLENYIPAFALNRLVPNARLDYGDWDHVKTICKSHAQAGRLGGQNVAERHFSNLTYEELKFSFNCSQRGDEFIEIYDKVVGLRPYSQ